MKTTKQILISGLIAIMLMAFLPEQALAAGTLPPIESITRSDEILVEFKEHAIDLDTVAGTQSAAQFAQDNNLHIKESLPGKNLSVLETNPGQSVEEAIEDLKSQDEVARVQPNFIYKPAILNTDDTHKNLLWALDNYGQIVNFIPGTPGADLRAEPAWSLSEGLGVTVAVIDVGTNYLHPDLVNNAWDGALCKDDTGQNLGGCLSGYDYEDNDLDPSSSSENHGTHVAGIIAAEKNNGIGVIGIAPKAKIMGLKTDLTSFALVKAINFAGQNGAKIINASWGAYSNNCDGAYDPLLYTAVANFSGLFVAAAGNNSTEHNNSFFFMPSDFNRDTSCWDALPNIISVAATDSSDNLASFSNYGTNVDVAAPGVNIASTIGASGYAYMNGTSMAAPYVSGTAALLLSQNPTLTPEQLKNILISKSDLILSLTGKVQSGGRINAQASLTIDPLTSQIVQVQQLIDGTGKITVDFEISGGSYNQSILLGNFQYSIQDPDVWQAPPLLDLDPSLSASWTDNDYLAGLPDQNYSFQFNTKALDDLKDLEASIKIRFDVSTGPIPQTLESQSISLDNIAPQVSLIAPPADPDTQDIANYSLEVGGNGVSNYKYKFDNQAWSSELAVTDKVELTQVLNGPHTISLVGKDIAGNWQLLASPTTSTWTVNDSTAPQISGLTDDSSGPTNKTWDWTSNDLQAQFRFAVNQTEQFVLDGDYGAIQTASIQDQDGLFYLHVQAIDKNNNESVISTISVALVQPLPPPPPEPSPTPAPTPAPSSSSGGGGGGGSFTPPPVPPPSGGGGGGGSAAPAPAPLIPPAPAPIVTPEIPKNDSQILGETISVHSVATLVIDQGTVYIITNQTKRPFMSSAEFLSYNFSFEQIVPANSADMNLPTGEFIKARPGTLALDGRTIFLITSEGEKRPFTSMKAFSQLGFKLNQVVKFGTGAYQQAVPITTSLGVHPNGTIVISGKTVWWIFGNTRRGFDSVPTFLSYGFSFKNLPKANIQDMKLPIASPIQPRNAMLTS